MALVKHFIGEMSGKIGGAVFGHNRGGSFVRKWKKPTNPNSSGQQYIRTQMANLASRWNDDLVAAHRDSWTTYGKNVAMKNRLGETIYLTGQQHFVRSNAARGNYGLDFVDTAPSIFNLGELTFTSAAITVTDEITVNFDDTVDWCSEDGAGLLLRASAGMNPTINFSNKTLKKLGIVAGNSVTPATTPATMPAKFNYADGQRVFFEARLSRADGRLSAPIKLPITVAIP